MQRHAFFDLDGTLLNTRSLIAFLEPLALLPGMEPARFARFRDGLRLRLRAGQAREELNRYWFTVLQGLAVRAVDEAARAWFAARSREPGFYNPHGLALLAAERAQGARTCLVTGSFPALARPIAQALDIGHVLCSLPEENAGRYTGQLLGAPCIGAGKAQAVRAFAAARGIALAQCAAFGDDASDQPMLDAVGRGVRVPVDARYAAEWRRLAADPPSPEAKHG